jgi:hypothetical protein
MRCEVQWALEKGANWDGGQCMNPATRRAIATDSHCIFRVCEAHARDVATLTWGGRLGEVTKMLPTDPLWVIWPPLGWHNDEEEVQERKRLRAIEL